MSVIKALGLIPPTLNIGGLTLKGYIQAFATLFHSWHMGDR